MEHAVGEKANIRQSIPAPHMFLNSFERAANPNDGRSATGAGRPIPIPINSTHMYAHIEISLGGNKTTFRL